MKVIANPSEVYRHVQELRCRGQTIGLVPTMGALHAGHYSLVRTAKTACDTAVATIFVNPTQFGPNEDYSRYPRTLESDLEGLAAAGAEVVFVPEAASLYGPSHGTWVEPTGLAEVLEGQFRPGHYRGVATIVLKLFHLIPADIAYFGEKDYQQLMVIRRLVEDLNVPLRVEGCPTVREHDGLAMSSRNRYLSAEERQRALALSRALRQVVAAFEAGQTSVAALEREMQRLLAEQVDAIDYARIVDGRSLQSLEVATPSAVALIAARVGRTRLIDNMKLG
jgi:pantoate--beta-alanine ligase